MRSEGLGEIYNPSDAQQVSSLESSKKTLLVDVAAAEAAEKEAIVTLSEVQIQFRNSEQFLGNRVKDLEEEGTRLKQEVTMGADAVEVCNP